MRRAARAALLTALVPWVLWGCTRDRPVAPECLNDGECGGDQACSGGSCIPRAVPPASWSVELLPRASDAVAAITEVVSVGPTGGRLDLTATPKLTIGGAFAPDAAAAVTAGHIVLTVPSAIPGRPDLVFETDLPPATDVGTPPFTLAVPQAIVGRQGTLRLIPATPDDRTHPPALYAVTVAPTLLLPTPPTAFSVRGRTLSALGDARVGLMARAFQGNELVSNVALTQADGVFTLMIPQSYAALAPPRPITIELAPPPDVTGEPRFSTRPLTVAGAIDLGNLQWPAFSQPNAFRFAVHGDTSEGPVIADAVVRAWTVLAEEASGTTDFLRDGKTDSAGLASLNLLPGTAAALRLYDVAVTPPPDSPYGVRCVAKLPLAAGGAKGTPANLPPIVLTRRLVVDGTLWAQDGSPAAGVTVLATRTAVDDSTPCAASAGSPPAGTATDAHGQFHLSLDRGTYQFDYDPPDGAPYPRLTETDIVVTADAQRTIRLPQGALVEGTTHAPGGAPLPLAGVRLYELACAGAVCAGASLPTPLLRAQTRADQAGHFRAVIPLPTAAPSP